MSGVNGRAPSVPRLKRHEPRPYLVGGLHRLIRNANQFTPKPRVAGRPSLPAGWLPRPSAPSAHRWVGSTPTCLQLIINRIPIFTEMH